MRTWPSNVEKCSGSIYQGEPRPLDPWFEERQKASRIHSGVEEGWWNFFGIWDSFVAVGWKPWRKYHKDPDALTSRQDSKTLPEFGTLTNCYRLPLSQSLSLPLSLPPPALVGRKHRISSVQGCVPQTSGSAHSSSVPRGSGLPTNRAFSFPQEVPTYPDS